MLIFRILLPSIQPLFLVLYRMCIFFLFLFSHISFLIAMETAVTQVDRMPIAFFTERTLYAKKDGSLWYEDIKTEDTSLIEGITLYPESPIHAYKNGVFIWQKYNDLPYLTHVASDGKALLLDAIGFGARVCTLPNGEFVIRSRKGLYAYKADTATELSASPMHASDLASGYDVYALLDTSLAILGARGGSFSIIEKNTAEKWEEKIGISVGAVVALWTVVPQSKTIFYVEKKQQDCLKSVSTEGVARGQVFLLGNLTSIALASDGATLICGTDNGNVQMINISDAIHPCASEEIVPLSKKAIVAIMLKSPVLYAQDADGVVYRMSSSGK